jgi:metal-dependent amidase/aminoacylase/carboxypeptidase family protein
MEKSNNNVLGRPRSEVSIFEAFSYLTSGVGSIGSASNVHYQSKLARMDARIRSQQLVNDVRARAVKAASNAAAIFSVAAIDVTTGTANWVVSKSISEGNREVARILRTTL